MIIELIQDRKDNEEIFNCYAFSSEDFMKDLKEQASDIEDIFILDCISDATAYKECDSRMNAEYRIKTALIHYIADNSYDLDLCIYVLSRNWCYDDQSKILGLGVEI